MEESKRGEVLRRRRKQLQSGSCTAFAFIFVVWRSVLGKRRFFDDWAWHTHTHEHTQLASALENKKRKVIKGFCALCAFHVTYTFSPTYVHFPTEPFLVSNAPSLGS